MEGVILGTKVLLLNYYRGYKKDNHKHMLQGVVDRVYSRECRVLTKERGRVAVGVKSHMVPLSNIITTRICFAGKGVLKVVLKKTKTATPEARLTAFLNGKIKDVFGMTISDHWGELPEDLHSTCVRLPWEIS